MADHIRDGGGLGPGSMIRSIGTNVEIVGTACSGSSRTHSNSALTPVKRYGSLTSLGRGKSGRAADQQERP